MANPPLMIVRKPPDPELVKRASAAEAELAPKYGAYQAKVIARAKWMAYEA